MNIKQRKVLLVGLVLIIGMMLFPPWKYVYRHPGTRTSSGRVVFPAVNAERSAGYRFIASPPEPGDPTKLGHMFGVEWPYSQITYFTTKLDGARLMIQCLVVTAMSAGMILFLKKRVEN